MQYLQAKSIHSIPLIKEFEHNKMFLNELIQNLKPMVYLPGDYITSRVAYTRFCLIFTFYRMNMEMRCLL